MTFTEALRIVIELAQQNVIDPKDCPEYEDENRRQQQAIDKVSKHYGILTSKGRE